MHSANSLIYLTANDLQNSGLPELGRGGLEGNVILSETCLDQSLEEEIGRYSNHLWIYTSGTSNKRLVGLSFSALYASANSINNFYGLTAKDKWLIALPLKHIGGFSILVRAKLTNSSVVFSSGFWNAQEFVKSLEQNSVSLTSLVPTQVFDLVAQGQKAPSTIRIVFVGGASINQELYRNALDLGWPLIPTYGMTETASQIASYPIESIRYPESRHLKILPHLAVSILENDLISVSGKSICSAYFDLDKQGRATFANKLDGAALTTSDLGSLELINGNQILKILGRRDRKIKIKGSFLCIDSLQDSLNSSLLNEGIIDQVLITAIEDTRNGYALIAHSDNSQLNCEFLNAKLKQIQEGQYQQYSINRLLHHAELPLLDNGKPDYKKLA